LFLLPQPPECWDCSHMLPPVYKYSFICSV
jgi:hypothetical protein